MKPAEAVDPPYLCVFRNRFEVTEEQVLEFDYSADERCQIYIDGTLVACGPERSTVQRWFYNHVQLRLAPGRHCLTAALYSFGRNMTAYGQMSVRHGFAIDETSSPVLEEWEYQLAAGCTFANAKTDWASYPHILTDEDFNWTIFAGEGGRWLDAETFEDSRVLEAGSLPSVRRDEVMPDEYDRIGNVFIFHDYMTAWGEYIFSGTGEVRIRWAEPGCDADKLTPDFFRQRKSGDPFGCFSGPGDRFRLNGNRIHWHDHFWHAGRTLQITVFGDVKVEQVRFFRSGYPWKLKHDLNVPGEPELTRLLKRCWRTIEACTAETTMDCPYYEQLQYISDTRIQALCLYALTDDRRLIEKSLQQFAEGQSASGLMSCRYPTKEAVDYEPQYGELYRTHIPSFTALWIQMVHDFALLRCNDALTKKLLVSAEKAADYLNGCLMENGLLKVPGWNFIDWRDNWEAGFPPGCRNGEGCTLNLIYLRSLKDLADLESVFGTAEGAAQAEERAEKLASAIRKNYYVPERGLYAENSGRSYFSEHAQVWALLALGDETVIPALESGTLDESGIAFSFYYLAACRRYGLDRLFERRMAKYLETASDSDLRTMPEVFPNTWWFRSNCHAWGAHPLYWRFGTGSILDRIADK